MVPSPVAEKELNPSRVAGPSSNSVRRLSSSYFMLISSISLVDLPGWMGDVISCIVLCLWVENPVGTGACYTGGRLVGSFIWCCWCHSEGRLRCLAGSMCLTFHKAMVFMLAVINSIPFKAVVRLSWCLNLPWLLPDSTDLGVVRSLFV